MLDLLIDKGYHSYNFSMVYVRSRAQEMIARQSQV